MGLDLDRLRAMSLEEIDSFLRSQESAAAQAGALAAFFQENPHLRAESIANLEALERNAPELLQREDSRFLHLSNEEVQPWLTLFNERASQKGFLSSGPDDAASEESARRIFEELALPLLREMADSIFTRDRIRQLVAGLRKYQSERFAAGDRTTAGHLMGAINHVEREDSPGQNAF
jgi:hypothetical protein